MDTHLFDQARRIAVPLFWQVQMTIPSILGEGETFSLRISVLDPTALPADLDAELVFEPNDAVAGLPASVPLAGQGGLIEIPDLSARGAEMIQIAARVEAHGARVLSNPAWVFAEPPYRLFWGDLHVHTKFSNCHPWSCKDPEFTYQYAREVTHLDFAAAADHLRGIASDADRWPCLQQLAREYNLPGDFVAILGFESSHKTGMGGDNNAYMLRDDVDYFWLDRDDMHGNNPAVPLSEMWKFLDATGGTYMTIPHHTGRSGKYRAFDDGTYDPQREPLLEIYSAWGSSERRWNRFPLNMGNTDQRAYFCDALQLGCRFGVIASSDDHTTLPGGESRNGSSPLGPQRLGGFGQMGLAAVRAPELTREALFSGMRARQTFATTLDRTLVDVRIGQSGVGEEASVSSGDSLRQRRQITVRASSAQAEPLAVTLVRNGEDIETLSIAPTDDGTVGEVTFSDEAPLEQIAIRDAMYHAKPFACYYARLQARSGGTQWTSPIWLDLD